MSRTLIVTGVVIVLIGLLWPWLAKLPLGQLPGDISIQRENSRIYLPFTSMLLISLALSLLMMLLRR